MSKERKVRNFDFLKQTPPPLPSREEVIQKTAELTGQSPVGEEKVPSVSGPVETVSMPVVVPVAADVATVSSTVSASAQPVAEAVEAVKPVEKEKKEVKKRQKVVELPPPPVVVQEIIAKPKVGRRALTDSRKPFTTTITLDNKRRLRQLCAEHDIAVDALPADRCAHRPSKRARRRPERSKSAAD